MIQLKKIGLPICLILMLCITACNRQPCYECYGYMGTLQVSKMNDTFSISENSRSDLNAAITQYVSTGYTIDSIYGNFYIRAHPNYETNCGPNFTAPPQFDSCIYLK